MYVSTTERSDEEWQYVAGYGVRSIAIDDLQRIIFLLAEEKRTAKETRKKKDYKRDGKKKEVGMFPSLCTYGSGEI